MTLMLPQWSPSLADGTTLQAVIAGKQPPAAAMEPVLGGRDDPPDWEAPFGDHVAAMEPVLGGRDDSVGPVGQQPPADAAMEPVLGGRDDGRAHPAGPACRRGRNGARPWRTGRRVPDRAAQVDPGLPQWSPSLADGTTCRRAEGEPEHSQPQWSPSLADGTTGRRSVR